jgi:divalent metal cation (Fe/Co/Zn/Cd) transporter
LAERIEEVALSFVGCLLMVSGWLIAIAALLLLVGSGQRLAFVMAGLLVESIGLVLVAQSYRALQKAQG